MRTLLGNEDFTAKVICITSKDYFPDNKLTSFRTFQEEEIALDGDWRVPLSETFFQRN